MSGSATCTVSYHSVHIEKTVCFVIHLTVYMYVLIRRDFRVKSPSYMKTIV